MFVSLFSDTLGLHLSDSSGKMVVKAKAMIEGALVRSRMLWCSGQALFQQDKLDLHRNLADDIVGALKEYNADVKSGAFLAEEHCYPMTHEELSGFLRTVDQEQPKVQQDIRDKRSTETTTGRSIKWTIK
ncbi:hypothetical protein EDD21DRAFT_349899 [Dissophora ornata]|nr:hypothetical protein EDD21DRAFT_349899 [Dissophora ornata]